VLLEDQQAQAAAQAPEQQVSEGGQKGIRLFDERFGERVKSQFEEHFAQGLQEEFAQYLDEDFQGASYRCSTAMRISS
jgi:hypothetical protein